MLAHRPARPRTPDPLRQKWGLTVCFGRTPWFVHRSSIRSTTEKARIVWAGRGEQLGTMWAESFGKLRNFHFVGIGGIGMSALAEILLDSGYEVTGSDLSQSETTAHLEQLGARIHTGHSASHLQDIDVVVVSSAIHSGNVEVEWAHTTGVQIVHRAELLAELMRFKEGITVTGTHGKTTVTSMIGMILLDAGLDPTIVVGARLKSLGSNAHLGTGDHFVAEADESDRSLLKLRPVHTVLTNIDDDHLDEYANLEDLQNTFQAHLESVPFQGSVITCNDDLNTRALLRKLHRPVVTYALDYRADYSASRVRLSGLQTTYLMSRQGTELGEVKLRVPGRHNVQNSLGAAAMALSLGIPFESVCASLGSFVGAERRLEWKGEKEGVWVIDDYGHHPSEIKATLEACREIGRRIVLVFQPHRYSRTAQLANQLARSFQDADELLLTDIYVAGERPIDGVDSKALGDKIAHFRTVSYVPSTQELLTVLRENTEPGDLLLTMGAGDVWKVGEAFLEESS